MINRENIGVISEFGYWPRASIPCPVEGYFWKLVKRLPADVSISQVDCGYHNAGWEYIEVQCKATSYGKAQEILEQIEGLVMFEFQEAAI